MKRLQFDYRHYGFGASLGLVLISLSGCGPQPLNSGSTAANRASTTNAVSPSAANPNASLAVASSSTSALPEAQGYRIGTDPSSAEAGPVRMAKFSLVSGPVDWRATSGVKWSNATVNLPLRQGSDIWTTKNARSEIQFDDGSDMRLGGGAVAELTTMYSDAKGEFTEIKLNNGVATFHLLNKDSLYQIDTPDASIKAYGPALIRVGDTSGLEVADHAGQVLIEGKPGKITLASDQYINFPPNATTTKVERAPAQDSWDKFNDNRDALVYQKHDNMPDNISLMAGDMNSYGSWHNDPSYGEMWAPREAADWQPYHNGRWVWADPYGWTWVGSEPWGWAPYHYGAWSHRPWGWGWSPGPARQYWSPAVVEFSEYNNNVAWCALDPHEVRYPTELSVGIGSGNWFLSFGIGGTACYYPGGGGYCEPHPWRNDWVNGGGNGYNITTINNYYGHDRGLASSWRGGSGWVPRNARYGSSYVAANGFGNGTGGYHHLDSSRASFFSKGQSFHSPQNGAGPISGPFNVHPNTGSFTASRHFSGGHPSEAIMNRSVYRSATPTLIAQHSTGQRNFTRIAGQQHGGATASELRNTGNRAGQANVARPATTNRYNRFNNVSHDPNAHAAATTRAATNNRTSTHATTGNGFYNHNVASHAAQARATTQANHHANVVRRQATSLNRTRQASAQRTRATQIRRSSQSVTRRSNNAQSHATHPAPTLRSNQSAGHRTNSFSPRRSSSFPSHQSQGSGFQNRGNNGGGHQNRGGGNMQPHASGSGTRQARRGGGNQPRGGGGGHQGHGGGNRQSHGGGDKRPGH